MPITRSRNQTIRYDFRNLDRKPTCLRMNRQLLPLTILLFLATICLAGGRTWYKKSNVGGDARHRCTAFSIGNKGYYGGGHVNSGTVITYKDYWEYDPAINTWTQIADFGGGLRYHSSAFTIDGIAYVGGGEDHYSNYTNDFWKYIPAINTWYPIADLPAEPRRGGVAFSINNKGYYGTGQSLLGYHSDFYVYDPEINEWDTIASMPGEPRNAAVSFTYNNVGYVGTGHKVGEALNDFYAYHPESDTWTTLSNVGGSIRQDATGFCIDNKGYIGLGNDNIGNDFRDIWEYDFETDTWTQIADFLGEKRRYAATFTINNTPYVIGGTDGTNFKDTWAFSPALSVDNETLKNFQIYPNPTTDILNISVEQNGIEKGNYQLEIINLKGEVVVSKSIEKNPEKINVSNLSKGVYTVQVKRDNSLVQHQKIVLQ